MLTSLHTLHTTNTACLADFHCFCTLICIDAKYMMFLLEWYKCDHMLRTCLHTDTTANTLVLIDLIFGSHKVDGLHGTVAGAVVTAGAQGTVDDKHGVNSFPAPDEG